MDIFGTTSKGAAGLTRVERVEDQVIIGPVLRQFLLDGAHMTLMQVHFPKGGGSPPHAHAHESMVYVLQGRVEAMVGDRTEVLEAGDFCLHLPHVRHSVMGLEDSVVLEIKSPAIGVGPVTSGP